MHIYFDGYPPYSGAISEIFETTVDSNIQCDRGYAYFSNKEKIRTCINGESWEIMQEYFLDAKQVKNSPQQQYAINVHMLKLIEIKLMGFLISPR